VSLATRCSACGTVFRVVQDQLRVSGGWVRCGRCGEVFNAVESLVDLELDRAAEDATPSAHGPRVMQDLARVAGDAAAAGPGESPPALEPAPVQAETGDVAPAHDEGSNAADSEIETNVAVDAAGWPDEVPSRPPSFVRSAERAARWRQPRVRALLALLAFGAAGLLLWQLVVTQHDGLAARWPALRPWVDRFCAQAGCKVQAPMQIEGLSVESSGLVRTGPPGVYRLQLSLRNREPMALRMPHVELSLTDALGQILARRVLSPAQLGAAQDRIDAASELPLSVTLRTRDARVVGYTVEIFYP
jgi:predicted Zn finger-like uncharacterized protein